MNTQIDIYTRSVYGIDRTYVADPDMARAIAGLTGAKTLESRHVAALRALGFTFRAVLPPGAALALFLGALFGA